MSKISIFIRKKKSNVSGILGHYFTIQVINSEAESYYGNH